MKNIKFIIKNAQDVNIEGEEFEFVDTFCKYSSCFHKIDFLMRGKSKRVHNNINVISGYVYCNVNDSFKNEEDILDYIKNNGITTNIQEMANMVYKSIDAKKEFLCNLHENKCIVSYTKYENNKTPLIGIGIEVVDLEEDLTDELETIIYK